ncbi:MAG: Crp/Fnr family transcriptional regulator [Candidatus Magnetoovum sp. WYHC-5]|nr:Crp/Fnr family transcriptional regulator [Candidatus Magnetoovum sp. WYHC-5]
MSYSNFLKGSALFDELSEDDRLLLYRASRPFKYLKNDVVFLQGDKSNTVFFLDVGMVKISRINPDGRKLTFELVEAGDLFGELSLSNETLRRAMAEAVEDCAGYVISAAEFEVFLRKRPDIALKIIQRIGDKRLIAEKLLEDMIFMDVQSRVISLIMRYSHNDSLKLHFTHQEIADMTGTTRVSVSRTISKLRKRGVIETTGERIKIKDINALKKLASDVSGTGLDI